MFDLVVRNLLQHGFERFVADPALFASAVGVQGFQTSLVESWRTGLAPDGKTDHVRFVESHLHEPPRFPTVAVTLDEEPDAEGFFGAELEDEPAHMVRAGVTLIAYEANPGRCRALYRVCFAVMLAYGRECARAGFKDLTFAGGGQLGPEEKLFPELFGVDVRRQRWTARELVTAPRIEPLPTPFVLTVVNDGTGGPDGLPGGLLALPQEV